MPTKINKAAIKPKSDAQHVSPTEIAATDATTLKVVNSETFGKRPEQTCPLFKIPYAVRRLIYEELLLPSDPKDVVTYPVRKQAIGLQPVVLRLCKQAHEEAGPILYRGNTFRFTHPSDATVLRTICTQSFAADMHRILLEIPERKYNQLWADWYKQTSGRCRSLLGSFPALKHLIIHFQGSQWSARRTAEDNLAVWFDQEVFEDIEYNLDLVLPKGCKATLMCVQRIPQAHFLHLHAQYAHGPRGNFPPDDPVKSPPIKALSRTQLRIPSIKKNALRTYTLELHAPDFQQDEFATHWIREVNNPSMNVIKETYLCHRLNELYWQKYLRAKDTETLVSLQTESGTIEGNYRPFMSQMMTVAAPTPAPTRAHTPASTRAHTPAAHTHADTSTSPDTPGAPHLAQGSWS